MPVQVMQVVTAEKHPYADTLFVYTFKSPTIESLQIVANSENIYKVGDLANIALESSTLKDGTKIKKANLRGVNSFGMALGLADDTAKAGDDVSEQFCISPSQELTHIPWPSIENLYNVVKNVDKIEGHLDYNSLPKTIKYRFRVKLDGTNAGIQIKNGNIAVQSRTNIITPQHDNMGFARFVDERIDYFKSLDIKHHITIFGEFCGIGIQKRTAVSAIDRKIMAVFAIQYGDGSDGMPVEFEIEPENIRKVLPEHKDVFVLPWYGPELTFNYADKASLQSHVDTINTMVEDVERCDPWVKDTFGFEGLGEGVVAYPVNPTGGRVARDYWTSFAFKAKGEKHKVVNTKKPAQLEPEFVANIDDFVKLFVTEARLEQGVAVACGGKYEMEQIGEFLKWFGQDVKKESVAELEKAGLKWKQVGNFVITAAREWYKGKAQQI